MNIGGKFIFKSNVIHGPGEMPPGAPFLLMKQPQGNQVAPNPFPGDHGRVVLVSNRHPSPTNSHGPVPTGPVSTGPQQQPPQQQPQLNVSPPGHSTLASSSQHGHNGTSNGGPKPTAQNTNGNGAVSSSSVQNNGNRRNGNGKVVSLNSREKKDLFTQRKQREFIPDNKKDDNYWDRRRRNNEAAKRSREKRRFNDMILEQRVIELTKENHILKAQLDAIKDKYNICGGDLISLDQIMSTMPTPDQVLNVNNAGQLTITSGLTTQHFRNFQMAREARGESSPAKKMKLSPKSEDRSNSGADDEESHNVSDAPQPDSQRRDHSPEKDFYKRSVSPQPMPSAGVMRLVGSSPLPPSMNKSPPNGLINYSLRDIYYNNGNAVPMSSESGPNPLLAARGHPLPHVPSSSMVDLHPHHLERTDSNEFGPSFQYASSSSSLPIKYEEPDDGHPQPHHQHHHHCASPPYRPHPAHLPMKVPPSTGPHYFYDEHRRKRFEVEPNEAAPEDDHDQVDRDQFMLLHRRQPEGAHLSQLELILNLSAKRDTEVDQRSDADMLCTDRDSPVLMVAKNHHNLLPLKLRHKNSLSGVKHENGGPEVRRVQMVDDGVDEDGEPHHAPHLHHHHHHHLHPHHMEHHSARFEPHPVNVHHHHHPHLRFSPHIDPKGYPEDSRLVKTEDYDDEDEELQHQRRIIEGGNARRVHCLIEVEKLPSPRSEEEDKRYRSSVEVSSGGRSGSPKPNNSILKTQLARLENEMATIKNMMYMNTNQATAAAQ